MKSLNLWNLFDLIINEETTNLNKPHPDPYLYALNCLNADKDTSILFEDSSVGIESAKRAGIENIVRCSYY